MPERHAYRLRPFVSEARCAKWGCLEPAMYEALYQFQHAGEAQATLRRWPYCLRHAQAWATIHGLAMPDAAPRPVSEIPEARDREPEPAGYQRRQLGAGRLWGTRARARLRRGLE